MTAKRLIEFLSILFSFVSSIIPSAREAILIAPKGIRGVEKTLGDLKKYPY